MPEPKCECWCHNSGSYDEPPEWEQNPDCPVHPMTPVTEEGS